MSNKDDNKGTVLIHGVILITGKGNPRYEYNHSDGNFRATLHLPGIDVGISGDPAPTKQQVTHIKREYSVIRLHLYTTYVMVDIIIRKLYVLARRTPLTSHLGCITLEKYGT